MSVAVREFRITGRTVLFGLIGFFGVIIAVNMAFVYFALETWPGLSTQDAYQKGIAYNRTLDAAAAQSKLGWRSQVRVDKSGRVDVIMVGRDGKPVTGLSVRLHLERPLGEPMNHDLDLREAEPGKYVAAEPKLANGRWYADVTAKDNAGDPYLMRHTLTLGP